MTACLYITKWEQATFPGQIVEVCVQPHCLISAHFNTNSFIFLWHSCGCEISWLQQHRYITTVEMLKLIVDWKHPKLHLEMSMYLRVWGNIFVDLKRKFCYILHLTTQLEKSFQLNYYYSIMWASLLLRFRAAVIVRWRFEWSSMSASLKWRNTSEHSNTTKCHVTLTWTAQQKETQ